MLHTYLVYRDKFKYLIKKLVIKHYSGAIFKHMKLNFFKYKKIVKVLQYWLDYLLQLL